jgi:hypothetical protein
MGKNGIRGKKDKGTRDECLINTKPFVLVLLE